MKQNSSDKQRVVITGIGLVSPVGNTTTAAWQAICAGKSGIRPADHLPGDAHSVAVAGYPIEYQEQLNSSFPQNKQRKTDRFIHFAMLAGNEAMTNAGLSATSPTDRERFGVYLGVGVGGLRSISESTLVFKEGGKKAVSPFTIPKLISSEAPAWLSIEWNLQGPILAHASACASGADALGLAYRLIRDGYADAMLAGGVESCATPLSYSAFSNMRALSNWKGDPAYASRPFAADRTGFVMAEGAGILVLERLDQARARGAHIHAEIVAYGATSDAFHITAMDKEGRGAQRAIEQALAYGNIAPENVGYINAHGTGTQMNDAIEASVISRIYGKHADKSHAGHLKVGSTKSMSGHMLGAAGGFEAAVTALTLEHQLAPPTINLTENNVDGNIDYILGQAQPINAEYALSHSFGFGGGNAVLAFRRYS